MMVVGILYMDLFIPESSSLKMKRSVVKSLKDRIRNRFNVSVAEVDHTEKWQRTALGVAAVSNDTRQVESILSNVLDLVQGEPRAELIEKTIRYV
jgi:uncharacterized protein YlxP (DUF503 family)